MRILLEDFVPTDRSVRWVIQDAYFADQGISPWTKGEIPEIGTNNFPIMRQHALLLLEVVDDLIREGHLRPDEPLYVLELGGGLGKSAFNFHHALRTGCGTAGKTLARRLRYVFSDYSRSTLHQAMEEPSLQLLLESGHLIPAYLDLRQPSELQSLDGSPIQARFAAILASYVCDCTPTKVLQKKQDRFFELAVQTWAEHETERDGAEVLREYLAHPGNKGLIKGLSCPEEWRRVRLDDVLPSKLHVQAVRTVTADYPVATLAYPYAFLEALHQLQGLSIPGALFLVNDFGTCLKSRLATDRDRVPRVFGNASAYSVNFAILEAFARAAGWDSARTDTPSLSVHTIGMRTVPKAPPSYHRAFRNLYAGDQKGQEYSDFRDSGHLAEHRGKYQQAIRYMERCLRLAPEDLETHYHLSRACRRAGLFEEAVVYAKKGRKLTGYGTYDFEHEVARTYEQMGRSGQALQWYKRSLTNRERTFGPEHPRVATSLHILAEFHRRQRRYAEAEPLYQRSLVIQEKTLGSDHPDVARSLNNLALLYYDQGRYGDAEPLNRRALAVRERTLGSDHPDVAQSLNNLAGLYHAQGRHDDAEPLYRRALAVREKTLGSDHPDVAQSLNNLAGLYHTQGRHDDAEPLYHRALAIREKTLGSDHPDVAQSLDNLALLYHAQDRHDDAEPLYRRALAVREKTRGSDHPDVAQSLNNLAEVCRAQGKHAEAEPLYQRTLVVAEKAFGPEHPRVAAILEACASLLRDTGRNAEAAKTEARAKAIRAKHGQDD